MRYIVSLPITNADGKPKELFSDDPALIARFIAAEDRPGRGVYECINPLVPEARKRCLETVADLSRLYFDLDLQHVEEDRDEVLRRLQQLPFEFTWVRDSGSGNLHLGTEIKDPPLRGTPEYDKVAAVWKRLAEKLAADPAPTHPAALIRCVGTHNRKNGGDGLCRELTDGPLRGSGRPADITEIEALDELLSRPLFTRKDKPATNGHDSNEDKAPVDIDARLAAMRWHGAGDSSVNVTTLHVMASQLRRGISLKEATEVMLAAAKRCVAGEPGAETIDWQHQELEILWNGAQLINKEHELADRLPDELYAKFKELDRDGRRPVICRNRFGIFVRPSHNPDHDANGGSDTTPLTLAAIKPNAPRKQNQSCLSCGRSCRSILQSYHRDNGSTADTTCGRLSAPPLPRGLRQKHSRHDRGHCHGNLSKPARRAARGTSARLVSQRRRAARGNAPPRGSNLSALQHSAGGISWLVLHDQRARGAAACRRRLHKAGNQRRPSRQRSATKFG